MCSEGYLPSVSLEKLRALSDRLNANVVDQVNGTEELLMLNNFSQECNEFQYRNCSNQRISDIASWRWVLEDLVKRLNEAVGTLEYEHKALRVVVHRVKCEIEDRSGAASRPGAFCPLSDIVEDAILQEFKFLRDNKKKFEEMILSLEKEVKLLNETKKRIEADILHKTQTISIEESCANMNMNCLHRLTGSKRKKKRTSCVNRWENRCASLKAAGLRALTTATIVRQQVRGARTHLSIAASAYGARVDSALRRRLHSNKIKLQDLRWQRDEALRDYKSLEEELTATEHNLLNTMDQEQIIEGRLADRSRRPSGELIRDEVDRHLRDELARLKSFSKQLRNNLNSIASLQNHLAVSMSQIDNCSTDVFQVICLDEDRIRGRFGEVHQGTSQSRTALQISAPSTSSQSDRSTKNSAEGRLESITEEKEEE